jgi:glycopeptide antibiotics resistance protein
MRPWRILLLLLLSIYVLFLFNLTLFQFPSSHPPPNLIPLRSIVGDWRVGGRIFVVNFLGNIVAFMPVGVIPSVVRPGRTMVWHAASFSLLLSAIIESGQYVSGHRVADVDDLILNTLGGLLGYVTLRCLRGHFVIRDGRDNVRNSSSAVETKC